MNAAIVQDGKDNPKTEAKRILWFDVFRVLCMLGIIASHMSSWTFVNRYLATSSSVQFFFFLSALLMAQSSWGATWKRLMKLLVPYLIWCVIGYTFLTLKDMTPYSDLTSLSAWNDLFGVTHSPDYGGLWFLRALILLTLIHPVLCWLPKHLVLVLFALSLGYVAYTSTELVSEVACGIIPQHYYSLGLTSFLLGVWLRRTAGLCRVVSWTVKHAKLLAVLFVALLAIRSTLLVECPLSDYFAFTLMSITLCPVISILLANYLPRLSEKIAQLAPAIFFVYVSHFMLTRIAGKIYLELADLGYQFASDIVRDFGPFCILAFCCVVFFILRPYRLISKYLLLA